MCAFFFDNPRDFWEQRIGHQAQMAGTRHVILNDGPAKGTAAIDVDTGTGLRFTVLPDRGLDISRASFNQYNLVYLTPNGEVHPAFYDRHGEGWLRNFFAGLLTTCGLTTVGPPGMDGDAELGLHGRYTNLPALRVQDRSGWDGDRYCIEIVGTVEQCILFGNKMRLTRTLLAEAGVSAVTIRDRVENYGYAPSPYTILYHINAGFPLLSGASELVLTAEKTEPCDAQSKPGMENWMVFSDPIAGFEEENFLHTMRADASGLARVGFLNPSLGEGLGLQLRFDTSTLPFFNEWKMVGQKDYVVGIEPCNAPCENRATLREMGLLPMLAPGESCTTEVEISVLEGADALEVCRQACRGVAQ